MIWSPAVLRLSGITRIVGSTFRPIDSFRSRHLFGGGDGVPNCANMPFKSQWIDMPTNHVRPGMSSSDCSGSGLLALKKTTQTAVDPHQVVDAKAGSHEQRPIAEDPVKSTPPAWRFFAVDVSENELIGIAAITANRFRKLPGSDHRRGAFLLTGPRVEVDAQIEEERVDRIRPGKAHVRAYVPSAREYPPSAPSYRRHLDDRDDVGSDAIGGGFG